MANNKILSVEEEAKLIKSLKFVHFKKGEIVEGQNELLKNMIFLILNAINCSFECKNRKNIVYLQHLTDKNNFSWRKNQIGTTITGSTSCNSTCLSPLA